MGGAVEQIELRHFRKDLAGEIDILVVPNGQPEQSTAIHVKASRQSSVWTSRAVTT